MGHIWVEKTLHYVAVDELKPTRNKKPDVRVTE